AFRSISPEQSGRSLGAGHRAGLCRGDIVDRMARAAGSAAAGNTTRPYSGDRRRGAARHVERRRGLATTSGENGDGVSARDDLRNGFLHRAGWQDAAMVPITGDASFRRYFRLQRDGEVAVLMDAPPPQEDVRSFVRIARHLASLGFSTPRMFAEDVEHGFLLIEDFGDDTYTRVLDRGGDERSLYRLATDVLIELHKLPAEQVVLPGVPLYETDAMTQRAMLLVDWYLPMASGQPTPPAVAEEFRSLWQRILPRLDAGPRTLVLRDFHVDNLMLLPGRSGIAACGLLDFQDAGRGAKAYDLVSLIEDARRDIAPELHQEMMNRYLATVPAAEHAEFRA